MVNAQNEIRYRVAFGILKRLYADGLLNNDEFDVAHGVVIDRYRPIAVCRLP